MLRGVFLLLQTQLWCTEDGEEEQEGTELSHRGSSGTEIEAHPGISMLLDFTGSNCSV